MRFCKWLAILGFALLAALPAGCGRDDVAGPSNGAPRFALSTRDGQVITSDSLKGRFVLLNFWSTTCAACVREIPQLQQLDDSAQAKVVGIALDAAGWKSVQPFVDKHRVRYSVVIGDEELFLRFDGYGLPHSLLLDREQRVVKVYRGALSRATVEKDIKALERGKS